MQKVLFEIDNHIGIIRLNRPDKMNALCIDMVERLHQIASEIEENNTIKALFITGNIQAFSAGGDLPEMQQLAQPEAERRSAFVQATFQRIGNLPIPVIALVSGIAFGGGFELALHTDYILASHDARFALPEIRYGMIPGAGGTVALPRRLPAGEAAFYLFSGQEIPTQKLLDWGILHEVIHENEWDSTINKQIQLYQKAPIAALRAIKRQLLNSKTESIEKCYRDEAAMFAALLNEFGKTGIESGFKNRKQ